MLSLDIEFRVDSFLSALERCCSACLLAQLTLTKLVPQWDLHVMSVFLAPALSFPPVSQHLAVLYWVRLGYVCAAQALVSLVHL